MRYFGKTQLRTGFGKAPAGILRIVVSILVAPLEVPNREAAHELSAGGVPLFESRRGAVPVTEDVGRSGRRGNVRADAALPADRGPCAGRRAIARRRYDGASHGQGEDRYGTAVDLRPR